MFQWFSMTLSSRRRVLVLWSDVRPYKRVTVDFIIRLLDYTLGEAYVYTGI